MRFLIAAVLFVGALFAILFGLALRTIWAPPESYTLTLQNSNEAPFLVVPPETLSAFPGEPLVRASGTEKVFFAVGTPQDVEAWIGETNHVEVAISRDGEELLNRPAGNGATSASPAGADLWQFERSGENSAQLTMREGQQVSLLIASDGTSAAPNSLQIRWPINYDLTPSNISLIAGAGLLLAAFIANIVAYYSLRKSRGPRRKTPKPPQGPRYRPKRQVSIAPTRGRRSARRALAVFPVLALTAGLLAGCSPVDDSGKPIPSPTPSASESQEPVSQPVVTEAQLKRILASVQLVAAAADEGNDPAALQARFDGPALDIRAVHYRLRTKSTSIEKLPPIVGAPVSFALPGTQAEWPRTLMVVTDAAGDETLPQFLVLQQDSPRTNYRVWYYVALIPGAEIPEVPAVGVGGIPVTPDSLFLKLPPIDLATAYGDVIDNGALSLSASLFDVSEDAFFSQINQSQTEQAENLRDAKITFKHSLGDPNVIALATSDSGALAAVFMKDSYEIKPTRRGRAVVVTGQEKILLGRDGSTTGIVSTYGDMLLFYIPSVSSDSKIKLLGASQGLLSVRRLD